MADNMQDNVINADAEHKGDFLSTYQKLTDNTYMFKKNGVCGIYQPDLVEYIKQDRFIDYINKGEDWVHKKFPDDLPSKQSGSYFFIVSKDGIGLEKNKNAYLRDWFYLSSKEKTGKRCITKWKNIQQADGTVLKSGRATYCRNKKMFRQIMFIVDCDCKPSSNILYQYICREGEPSTQSAAHDLERNPAFEDPFKRRPYKENLLDLHDDFDAGFHRHLIQKYGAEGNELSESILDYAEKLEELKKKEDKDDGEPSLKKKKFD